MSFWGELRRRNVVKVAVAYAIVGWLLVRVASVFAPALNLHVWTVGLVAFLIILGFPVALVLSWAYELTPAGIRKTRRVPLEDSVRHVSGRKIDFVIIGVLVLGIGFLVVDNYMPTDQGGQPLAAEEIVEASSSTESQSPSVAVLPFVSFSSDPDQEHIADGLSEELIHSLARIRDLRVTGRTSSFYFKGRDADLRAVGEKLVVEHILEGSKRMSISTMHTEASFIGSVDPRMHSLICCVPGRSIRWTPRSRSICPRPS
jgi:TolB-like protein